MPSTTLAAFLQFSRPEVAMGSAGIAILFIGAWAAKNDIARARGLDKIAALTNLCFAIPLAVFGAEHLSMAQSIMNLVPRYMPWRLFWAYFVGCALMAASLSIAAKIAVRWSALLFGIMMFLFVAMIHFPSALATVHVLHIFDRSVSPQERISLMIVFREMSFGGGGWILAGSVINGWRAPVKTALLTVGRILVALAAILFGAEHFLHPLVLPGVPLLKEMPGWIPGRALIDYVTGAALLAAGASFLLNRKTRAVATCVGGWILLLVLVIYGPVLILALYDPATPVQVEGINYFADTLLFAAAILAVASDDSGVDVERRPTHSSP